jgi:hypothetical protein
LRCSARRVPCCRTTTSRWRQQHWLRRQRQRPRRLWRDAAGRVLCGRGVRIRGDGKLHEPRRTVAQSLLKIRMQPQRNEQSHTRTLKELPHTSPDTLNTPNKSPLHKWRKSQPHSQPQQQPQPQSTAFAAAQHRGAAKRHRTRHHTTPMPPRAGTKPSKCNTPTHPTHQATRQPKHQLTNTPNNAQKQYTKATHANINTRQTTPT